MVFKITLNVVLTVLETAAMLTKIGRPSAAKRMFWMPPVWTLLGVKFERPFLLVDVQDSFGRPENGFVVKKKNCWKTVFVLDVQIMFGCS